MLLGSSLAPAAMLEFTVQKASYTHRGNSELLRIARVVIGRLHPLSQSDRTRSKEGASGERKGNYQLSDGRDPRRAKKKRRTQNNFQLALLPNSLRGLRRRKRGGNFQRSLVSAKGGGSDENVALASLLRRPRRLARQRGFLDDLRYQFQLR